MTKLSINRKPKGLFSNQQQSQAEPESDKPLKSENASEKSTSTGRKKSAASKRNHRRLEKLAGYFPNILNLEAPVPLKVGILQDMAQNLIARGETFGEGQIRNALTRYTHSWRYQSALAAGGARYNISGQPEGEVSAEQQQAASEELAMRKGGPDGK